MILPINNDKGTFIAEFDRLRDRMSIFYSREKDMFAQRISFEKPKCSWPVKQVWLRDRDSEVIYEVPLDAYNSMEVGEKKQIKISDLKRER